MNAPDITNQDRAKTAEVALEAFMTARPHDDAAEAIPDLLANLMHLCDQRGANFMAELTTALVNHRLETEAEADPLADKIREVFSDRYATDELELEMHDGARVSLGEGGAWVACHQWIPENEYQEVAK